MKRVYKLGAAIQWMMEHEKQEMIDSEGDHWYYDGKQSFFWILKNSSGAPVEANILLPVMLLQRFTIAKSRAK